jgi:hypothetical protein
MPLGFHDAQEACRPQLMEPPSCDCRAAGLCDRESERLECARSSEYDVIFLCRLEETRRLTNSVLRGWQIANPVLRQNTPFAASDQARYASIPNRSRLWLRASRSSILPAASRRA